MYKYNLVQKRVDKNNVAFWSLGKRAIPYEKILTDQDKEQIEKCSNHSYELLEDGQIRLYGHPVNSYDLDILNDDKKRYRAAIAKLKEGLGELELLRTDFMVTNMLYWGFFKCVRDKKLPRLDIEILLVIFSYFNYSYERTPDAADFFDECFTVKNKRMIISPTERLVDIFKKHFYPEKTVDEISAMLKGHVLGKEIIQAMYFMDHYKSLQLFIPFVAVVHSYSGRVKGGLLHDDLRSKLDACTKSLKVLPPKDMIDELQKGAYDSYCKIIGENGESLREYALKGNNFDDLISLLKKDIPLGYK